ncbi:hypothetical protein PG997_002843 [Apiospora hydei]|uniref:Uncharacterized protein n=1 Tax=Apiospora hydei TaxID=1337664 RepID=A0ABR1WXK6_9PEZI
MVLLGVGIMGSPILFQTLYDNFHLWTVVFRPLEAIYAHSRHDCPWSLCHWLPFRCAVDWNDDHRQYFIGNSPSSLRYLDSKYI